MYAAAMSLRSVIAQRCPKCLSGRVFPPFFRGPFRMNPQCPVCGIRFEREPGYFLGAIYFSYGSGVAIGSAMYLALTLGLGWSDTRALVVISAVLLSLTPVTFRYARVVWMHFDQRLDPR
jgi:uncharacterized protein (DUF983 family)